jgi:hypothetical protein
MIIDLTQIPIGIAETEQELMTLKSSKLVNELIKLNNCRKYKLNCITISPSILNIIELHQYFYSYKLDKEIESPFLIGKIAEYECYVDLYFQPNILKVSCDKQSIRDIKMESILREQPESFEYEIEIIF